jgi:membrane-associated phospholipid phosphatase
MAYPQDEQEVFRGARGRYLHGVPRSPSALPAPHPIMLDHRSLCPPRSPRVPRTPLGVAVAVLLLVTPPARAQAGDTTASARPLVTGPELLVAGAFAATAAGLLPFDETIARRMQRPGLQRDRTLRHLATDLRLIGVPGTVIAAPTLYVAGRLAHRPGVADLGLHTTEAIALAVAVGFVIKGVAGRARPFVVGDTSAGVLHPGRGFGDDAYASLPSGHAIAGFATASALTAEIARASGRATWYVAPLAYGTATLIALSRLYHDQHWASDVALGAGIGTLSGLAVVRYHHTGPRTWLDRWLLGWTIAPLRPCGLVLVWSY